MHTTESSRNKSAGAIYLVWLPHLVNWLQSEEACISQLHTNQYSWYRLFFFFLSLIVNFIQWQRERNLLEIAFNRTLQGKKMHKIYKWINWASIRYPRGTRKWELTVTGTQLHPQSHLCCIKRCCLRVWEFGGFK